MSDPYFSLELSDNIYLYVCVCVHLVLLFSVVLTIPCDLTKMLVILPAATAQAALSGSSETMTCWTSQCPRVLCGAVAVSEHLPASHGSDAPLTVELLCYRGRALVLQAG